MLESTMDIVPLCDLFWDDRLLLSKMKRKASTKEHTQSTVIAIHFGDLKEFYDALKYR